MVHFDEMNEVFRIANVNRGTVVKVIAPQDVIFPLHFDEPGVIPIGGIIFPTVFVSESDGSFFDFEVNPI